MLKNARKENILYDYYVFISEIINSHNYIPKNFYNAYFTNYVNTSPKFKINRIVCLPYTH